MPIAVRLTLVLALLCVVQRVDAADPPDPSAPAAKADPSKVAAEAYQRGMVHFQLDEYDAAIKEWQDGFRARPAPQLLYNIAQAYRLSKQPERALSYYRKYLNMEPKTPNRAVVERYIDQMSKAVEEQKNAPQPIAEPVAPSPIVVVPTPEIAPPPASAESTALVAHAPQKKPLVKRAWFWGVVAGSVVVVGTAIALGVVFGTKTTGPTVLDPVRF